MTWERERDRVGVMKIEHIKNPKLPPLSKFPLLAENITDDCLRGAIVIFIDSVTGIVVKKGSKNTYYVGERLYNLITVTNESTWRILSSDEQIILSN